MSVTGLWWPLVGEGLSMVRKESSVLCTPLSTCLAEIESHAHVYIYLVIWIKMLKVADLMVQYKHVWQILLQNHSFYAHIFLKVNN